MIITFYFYLEKLQFFILQTNRKLNNTLLVIKLF